MPRHQSNKRPPRKQHQHRGRLTCKGKKKTFSQKEERRAKGWHAPSFCKTQEMSYIGTENTSDHTAFSSEHRRKTLLPFSDKMNLQKLLREAKSICTYFPRDFFMKSQ
uniref:Uncharacterized protein n=1 Tax=Micrurus corallinus TaxID=54390 RepID=A0A2D4FE56_MICCO